MKTFFAEIIPQISRFSKQIDQKSVLVGNNWIFINPDDGIKYTYIFRRTGEMLSSANGNVVKGRWEQLNNGLLLIEDSINQSALFRYDFFNGTVLALNKEGTKEYAMFVNESKSSTSFNSVHDINRFLNEKYSPKPKETPTIVRRPERVIIQESPEQQALRRKQQELLVWLIAGAIAIFLVVKLLTRL